MTPFGHAQPRPAARGATNGQSDNKHKILVKVRADHDTNGSIRPVFFVPPDGEKVRIERLLDVREAASCKAGGQGLRYAVRVFCGDETREIYLFDDDGVWFIERD